MAVIVLAVLAGGLIFSAGLVMRSRKIILIGAPAALLLVIWYFLASSRPDPQEEFDRLFGAGNRDMASDIQTIKPTFMDGHFISFRMHAADFNAHIHPMFSGVGLTSTPNILLGQSLPPGWPVAIETTTQALHRKAGHQDVYLLYFPNLEMAYGSVGYDQW